MLPDGNDDSDMQLSSVPAVIVATTSCCDNSYDRAFMPSHHASLLQEERRIILQIHALMRGTMEEPRWEGKKTDAVSRMAAGTREVLFGAFGSGARGWRRCGREDVNTFMLF